MPDGRNSPSTQWRRQKSSASDTTSPGRNAARRTLEEARLMRWAQAYTQALVSRILRTFTQRPSGVCAWPMPAPSVEPKPPLVL